MNDLQCNLDKKDREYGSMQISQQGDWTVVNVRGLPPIYICASALSIPIICSISWLMRATLIYFAIAVMVVVVLVLSIILHEIAHALATRYHGFEPTRIILDFSGGEAHYLAEDMTRAEELHVALAGPLANMAIALVLLGVGHVITWWLQPLASPLDYLAARQVADALIWCGWINVLLGTLNMLPAYPLDGGTIVHQWIAGRYGDLRAQRIVGLCGCVCAVLIVIVMTAMVLGGIAFYFPISWSENWRAFRSTAPNRRKADNIINLGKWKRRR